MEKLANISFFESLNNAGCNVFNFGEDAADADLDARYEQQEQEYDEVGGNLSYIRRDRPKS